MSLVVMFATNQGKFKFLFHFSLDHSTRLGDLSHGILVGHQLEFLGKKTEQKVDYHSAKKFPNLHSFSTSNNSHRVQAATTRV